jgi:hypothetical protein
VNRIRSAREQLQARAKALEPRRNEAEVGELLKQVASVVAKADALEERLHNPKAEIVYDILAMRGGTKLYSRLSPLQMWAIEGEGAPTEGMRQVLAGQEQEMETLTRDTDAFFSGDIVPLNERAAALRLPFVIVR